MKEWKTSRLFLPTNLRVFARSLYFLGLLAISAELRANPEDLVSATWYQIDVVIFKPKNADLDEESWPVVPVSYPATVYSIYEPGIFKLSQLEQLEPMLLEESSEGKRLRQDEFVFESRANRSRNQRIIESVVAKRGADAQNREELSSASLDAEGLDPTKQDAGSLNLAAGAAEQVRAALEGITNPMWEQAFIRTDSSSSLASIARSVNRSSRFTLLSHDSWVQPVGAEDQTVMIQTGKRYNDQYEVEGTLAFSRSRFLHVDTNLWFTRFEPRGTTANPYRADITSTLDDATLKTHEALVEVERERDQYYPAQQYVMAQSRRMRSDELHYLDHPLIGIVIRINQYGRDIAAAPE
ncbi:MAG: hypothetical protein ACI8Z1_004041 [Candidatus Azotimanducaceae bacterium]